MIDLTKIPHGDYCYDDKGKCPYLSYRKRYKGKNLSKQENGYCKYLGKGDYELNRERIYILTYPLNDPNVGVPRTAEEIGIPLSLLWDSVKMCNENSWDEWELTLDLGVYGI